MKIEITKTNVDWDRLFNLFQAYIDKAGKMLISEIWQATYRLPWHYLRSLECGAGPDGNETARLPGEKWYIEGHPEVFRKHTMHLPNAYNFLLSDIEQSQEFILTSLAGNSSIEHHPLHQQELDQKGSSSTVAEVPSIRYTDFLARYVMGIIHLLVLDIEGHECNVLRDLIGVNKQFLPKLIAIECGYDWEDRKALLKELGYNIDFYYYNNCFLSLGASIDEKVLPAMDTCNHTWGSWTWSGQVIYQNDADPTGEAT